MQAAQSFQLLEPELQEGRVLRQGAAAAPQVRALQVLLYSLGYGADLSWPKYRADGDYGSGTAAALRKFLQANHRTGDGTQADAAALALMKDRLAVLPALQALHSQVQASVWEPPAAEQYGPALGLLGFQPHDLGGFAARQGISSPEPQQELIRQLAGQAAAAAGLGPDWPQAGQPAAHARGSQEAEIIEQDRSVRILDPWLSARFVKTKLGVYNIGEAAPAAFIARNQAWLMQSGLTASVVRVLLPVSANEGNLDAVNTWDDSFMTFGMFQWTAGQRDHAGELPGLLRRLREESPEAYASHFQAAGIDTTPETGREGYLTLGGRQVRTAQEKEQLRSLQLVFRFWRAGLDPQVQLVQVRHAADRIHSFRFNPQHYQAADRYPLGELVTSEYGMCLILDHHVNRPGHLMRRAVGGADLIGQALERAGLLDTPPQQWGTAEEARLIEAYLPLRAASSMTHGQERAERILGYASRGELSRERGSFQMPEVRAAATRSLDAKPQFPLADAQAYERRRVPGRWRRR
jgi:peptidoglycan hydrolase-like protein with peptidoglycan-binding domain